MLQKSSKVLYNSYFNFLLNLIRNISYKERIKIYKKFCELISFSKNDTIIDIGISPSEEYSENILLQKYPYKNKYTCLSNQDCANLIKKYKNIKFINGNACKTKLSDNKFNIVYSNVVLEHVGSYNKQKKFINELYRISSKVCFIVTPNRLHPIEFHTSLPLIHLLPKKMHRSILKFLGYKFLSKEKNLNLLTKNDIKKILSETKINNYKIISNKFLFFPSHLIIILNKNLSNNN